MAEKPQITVCQIKSMNLLPKLRRLFFPLLILSSVHSVSSQPQEAEKRLSDPGGGYSFTAPSGFDSQKSEEGFGFADTGKTVGIAVTRHNFRSFEEFAAQANLEKNGFVLVGKVQDLDQNGKTFLVTKQTAEGVLMVDTFVLFSPHGGGVMVVALSNKESNQKGFRAGLQVAKSVAFTKPQASEAASQWQTLLRGKHLIYLYTASGFSERTDIYLCPSGKFFYRSNSSSLSNNGSGVVGANSDGNWEISPGGGASLILRFGNGTARQYVISRRQSGDEIGLNGKRYFVQLQDECR